MLWQQLFVKSSIYKSFFSLNSYSMEKLFPKSFSPSVDQFLRVHYNFFIPSVMIGVLHATVIEAPHLHKNAYSSYRNAKNGMTSTRTRLPETMHKYTNKTSTNNAHNPASVSVHIYPTLSCSHTLHRHN